MKKLSPGAPYAPAQIKISDVQLAAVKAVQRGQATEEQQRVAWTYITEDLCETYGLSYRPESIRDTDFAEGKRFVGLQLVKLSKLDPKVLRSKDERSGNDDGNRRRDNR